jgi:hypothetical protein
LVTSDERNLDEILAVRVGLFTMTFTRAQQVHAIVSKRILGRSVRIFLSSEFP